MSPFIGRKLAVNQERDGCTLRSFLSRNAKSPAAPRSMARLCATSSRGSAPGAFAIAPMTCVVAMAAPMDALRVKKPKKTNLSALHQT